MADSPSSGYAECARRPVAVDFVAQNALGRESQLIFGGLAIDQEARTARIARGCKCSGAVAFFTDDEEQAEIFCARSEQLFGGADHGGNDAFGVGGAAAPDAIVVFARRKEGRHGVQMRGERDERGSPVREDVETMRLDGAAFDLAAGAGGEVRENLEDEGADGFFVIRDGLDVHKRAS